MINDLMQMPSLLQDHIHHHYHQDIVIIINDSSYTSSLSFLEGEIAILQMQTPFKIIFLGQSCFLQKMHPILVSPTHQLQEMLYTCKNAKSEDLPVEVAFMGGKDKRKARSCSSRCSTHHHHITVNPDDKDDNHGDGDGPAVQPIQSCEMSNL